MRRVYAWVGTLAARALYWSLRRLHPDEAIEVQAVLFPRLPADHGERLRAAHMVLRRPGVDVGRA